MFAYRVCLSCLSGCLPVYYQVLTMQGYGKEADLWSVGVIMFLLLCGKLPFDGDDHNEIIRCVSRRLQRPINHQTTHLLTQPILPIVVTTVTLPPFPTFRSTIQAELKVNSSVWSKLSDESKSLMMALLNKNPKVD